MIAASGALRLWISTDHDIHWPVGGASIVAARDEAEARKLLDAALRKCGLEPDLGYTLEEVAMDAPFARVLCDGSY